MLAAAHDVLHPGEGLLVHHAGHAAGNADHVLHGLAQVVVAAAGFVLGRRPVENVDAVVFFVAQHLVERAFREQVSEPRAVAHAI